MDFYQIFQNTVKPRFTAGLGGREKGAVYVIGALVSCDNTLIMISTAQIKFISWKSIQKMLTCIT